jgi:beta-N-acetylhexosaminidase
MTDTIMHPINRRTFLKQTFQTAASLALVGNHSPSKPLRDKDRPSLDVMIGQRLLVGFRGTEVDEDHPIVKAIEQNHLGGVILFDYDAETKSFDRNIRSPDQVKKLTHDLQEASSTPLLIAIDQEGGTVCRLKEAYGFPATESAAYLGTKDDPALTRQHALSLSKTLSEIGINLNLAPVVDLNINPDNPIIGQRLRSYSDNAEIVTKHALAFIQAHHENEILCTLKHFPGHGSSVGDTHHGLTDVTETWSDTELEPYAQIIQAGKADAIMTAHVFNRYLDARFPATLSMTTITGILRRRLQYDGVIVSDDLQMGAIVQEYDLDTAVITAIDAGVDILAFANNNGYEESVVTRVSRLIKQQVSDCRISETRIAESFRRIQRLKSKLSETTE